MRRKIFITGAAGKTGTALLELILERRGGAEVTCLCRSDACRERLSRFPVSIAEGDASDAGSLGRAYRGEETVIHLSSIFHSPAVLEACRVAERLVVLSSTGVFSRYRRTAGRIQLIEKRIESSGLSCTILRPTMIYGTPDDRNISRLVRFIVKNRIVPLPGAGKARFQPVHVTDLARCISACLSNDASVGKSYNVPGGSAHSLEELVEVIAEELGRKVTPVPVPFFLVLAAVRAASLLPGRRGIDTEQIERLREDKTFSYADAAADLGYAPMPFREGITLQLEAMGLSAIRSRRTG